jgi:hypothetical protein
VTEKRVCHVFTLKKLFLIFFKFDYLHKQGVANLFSPATVELKWGKLGEIGENEENLEISF